MTQRSLAMHYPGDQRARIRVGDQMGPGADGFMRAVTSVRYDGRRKRTLVQFRRVEMAPEGKRLVYYGGVDPDIEPPEPPAAPIEDRIEPR